jgi:type VI secretion system protein ImpA
MPSPSVLDFDALLAPIPGDDPSGGPIAFTLRQKLDLARKDVRPEDFDPKDPLRPAEARPADWPGIVALTSEALAHSSKDLLLVARLIEGATSLHGFAGLRDGLRLARRLSEEAWDRLRPRIEEPDDLEARAAAFHWLDDSGRGALFPVRVRGLPIFKGPTAPISWSDWKLAADGRGKVTVEDFAKAVRAAPRQDCQIIADDLDEVIDEFQKLLATLNEKMGQVSPGMTQLRQAVLDCQKLAHDILGEKGAAPAEAEAEGTEGPEAGESGDGKGGSSLAGAIRNRAQAYQKLNEIADALATLEPHSPIPFVIRRAIALGQLSFPELMKELIADATVLGDMSRNLGIKELTRQE